MTHVVTNEISIVIEAAFQHLLWQPKLEELAKHADIAIVVCSVDPHLARSRFIQRGLADSTRERFHGDKAVQDLPMEKYNPPELDLPTMTVDTTDGYNPSLDSLVEFALRLKTAEQGGAVDALRG